MLGRLRRRDVDATQSLETIDTEAAHWCERTASPDLTDAEGEAFRSWYAVSAAHRDAYDGLVHATDKIDQHAVEVRAIEMQSGETRDRRAAFAWRELSAVAAAAAMVLIAGAVFWGAGIPTAEPDAIVYKSGVGERRVITLNDGSTMTLNTASEVSVAMSNNTRRIDLVRGQGLFDVASDPDRPFQVHTSNGVIIAVGTAFDVRLHADGVSDFTLLEGRAIVSGKDDERARRLFESEGANRDDAIMLEPGQKVSAGADGALSTVAEIDLAKSSLWTDGLIVLSSASLEEALEEFNRYAPLRRRLSLDDDPALDDLRISGTFKTGDIAGFAQKLEILLPVAVTSENEKTVIKHRSEDG